MINRCIRSASFFGLVILAALNISSVASAQSILSVTPTSFDLQANVGTNPPSRTVAITNAGSRALKWSVVSSNGELAECVADERGEHGDADLDVQHGWLAGGPVSDQLHGYQQHGIFFGRVGTSDDDPTVRQRKLHRRQRQSPH